MVFSFFPGLSTQKTSQPCERPQVNAIRSGSEIEGWTQQEEFGDLAVCQNLENPWMFTSSHSWDLWM